MTDEAKSGREGLDSSRNEGSGRWILMSRIAAQLSQISLFLLAARFLSPAEFGVFALVQAFSALLFVGAAAGWRETIISTANSPSEIDQVMTLSLVSGAIMTAAGALVAIGLDQLGHPEAALLASLFCVCVVLAAGFNAFNGMLVRRGQVRAFAIASIIAEGVAFALAAWALASGYGIYALAIGKIVFLGVCIILLAGPSGWRGKLTLRGERTRLLISTSWHILTNRIIFFIQSNSSTFLVGAFLGPAGVGFYRAAERVVSSVAELVMEPLRMIAWVELRKVADHPDTGNRRLREQLGVAAAGLLPLFVLLTAPVFIGLAIVADALVRTVLGPAWTPSGSVAAIFAIAALGVVPGVLTEPLLSLTGEIRRLPKYLLLNAAFGAACLIGAGPFGLHPLAAASIPAGLFTLGTTFWILRQYGGFALRPALSRAQIVIPPLLAMAGAVLIVQWVADNQNMPALLSLTLQVIAGAAAYLGVLYVLRPEALTSIRRL